VLPFVAGTQVPSAAISIGSETRAAESFARLRSPQAELRARSSSGQPLVGSVSMMHIALPAELITHPPLIVASLLQARNQSFRRLTLSSARLNCGSRR
jgi:hypothetical protein